jgi:hypothetical protein
MGVKRISLGNMAAYGLRGAARESVG